jgi:hypothetical protein
MPEVWLRGPVPGVHSLLMPVVQSLLQVREELEIVLPSLSRDQVWTKPGAAASIGFHVKHLASSLDRLLTYARGEALSAAQLALLATEDGPGPEEPSELLQLARGAIDVALQQIRGVPVSALGESRRVGRAGLPSTVLGLLFHAAEHAQRHAGQIATTAKIVADRTDESSSFVLGP